MANYKSIYTGAEIDSAIGKANTALQEHQPLKTVNNESLVGDGNITIEGTSYEAGNNIQISEENVISATDTIYDDTELRETIAGKQEELISGTNIKTINGNSILGSGNLVIEGGEGGLTSVAHDETLTGAGTNENPLGVDTTEIATKDDLDDKQDKLVSGTNIKTINNTSLLGSGNIDIQGGGGTSIERLYTFNDAYVRWCSGETFPVAFCGDSTIAGFGTSRGKANAWVARLSEKLKYDCNNSNVKLYNLAQSGTTTPQPSQFEDWFGDGATYSDTKMVGIGWGINDRLSATSKKNYYETQFSEVEALILKAFELGIQPFMLTSQSTLEPGVDTQYGQNYRFRTSSDINICANNARRDLAAKYNLEIIDMEEFTNIYLKNSDVPVETIIPDRLHFANVGNLFEGGVAFSHFANRTIMVEERDQVIINYADQRVTHCVPENYISYGGGLKVYVDRENYGTDSRIFDAYVFIKDYPAKINAYKTDLDSDTYIKIDQEVPEKSQTVELDDLDNALEDLDVYTGSSSIADFAGFIINPYNYVPPVIPVQAIAFSQATYATGENQPVQTSIVFTPSNATNKQVTYTTTGGTITASGLFTATTAGTYTVTATSDDGGKTVNCSIVVTAPVAVTGVSLDQSTATLSNGGTLQLTATVTPSNATNKQVTWSVDNDKCTVSSTGLVECVSSGTGTSVITVTTVDGGYTATCTITIVAGPELLVDSTGISGNEAPVSKDANFRPAVFFYGFNGTNKTCSYSGSTITSVEAKATAGTFTIGKVDLLKYGAGEAITIIDPQTFTVGSGEAGTLVKFNFTTPLQLGANEAIAINPTTDTANSYFLSNVSGGDGVYETQTAFKNGTPNVIGLRMKLYGYTNN